MIKQLKEHHIVLFEFVSLPSLLLPSLRTDKGYVSVLLPMSKPLVVEKMALSHGDTQQQLQDKHVRHQRSGRAHGAADAPRAPSFRRASHSALL